MDQEQRRVASEDLQNFVGQIVIVVGRVHQTTQDTATLMAYDQGLVMVKMHNHVNFQRGIVEVVGRVGDNLVVDEVDSVNFGETFDLEVYARAIRLTRRFPQIF